MKPARASPVVIADRYLRHTQIDGFSQTAVAQLRVIVVGAGAIGNEVVKNLVLLGAAQQIGPAHQSDPAEIAACAGDSNGGGYLELHDFDRVERHNLTRSVLLRESDIGQNKSSCVAARARELDPAVHIVPFAGDIADTLSLTAVANADIVIGCVDNFEARIRLNQLCLLAGTAWINTAIDSRYASVEVFPLNASAQPPCFECTLPATVYERIAERRSCGGLLKTALAQQVMPSTTLTTSLVAALAVNQALLLTGCDNRVNNQENAGSVRLFADSLTGITSRSEIMRAPLCAGCDALPWRVQIAGSARSARDLQTIQSQRPQPINSTPQVQLSDAIIAAAQCTSCGENSNTTALVGRRAATVPDSVIICAQCEQASVAIDIKDHFDLNELVQLCADATLAASWADLDGHFIALGSKEDTS